MIEILLFFIAAALLLYVILGGADYGAGILELLPIGNLKEKQREVINYAMGPVWEANHIWLVLVIVILFMGFPMVFNTMMTYLHLPMVALLVGIVVRGTAFTFRHYDAIHEERSQNIYSWIFGLSSLWTALWIGIIAGTLGRGSINTQTQNFFDAYVAPWWGIFPLATGMMTVFIFAFLASVYLIGETSDPSLKKLFWRRGFALNIGVILAGALVFFTAYLEQVDLFIKFVTNPVAITMMILATALFFVLWYFVRRNRPLLVRVIGAGQVTLILFGWYVVTAPAALQTTTGPITFFQAAAPPATQLQLVIALLAGSLLIFPSLFFLLRVFKR